MLVVDSIKEEKFGKIHILECNPRGNNWHFSSEIGEKLRMGFGDEKKNEVNRANEISRRMFIDQCGEFDIVAEQLTRATQTRAE